jgi:hypothetical protein
MIWLLVAEVPMVSVEVPAAVGVTGTEAGLNEQVGAFAGDGDTEHARDTEPLNPACEVTVIEDVADEPWVTVAGDAGLALIIKVVPGEVLALNLAANASAKPPP